MTLLRQGLFLTQPLSADTSMTPLDMTRYAAQAGVAYPTTSGADLYRIAGFVPKVRRAAFEEALGDAIAAYYEELRRQGHEPTEEAPPDVLTHYLLPGLVTSTELFDAYNMARHAGQDRTFLEALQYRSPGG